MAVAQGAAGRKTEKRAGASVLDVPGVDTASVCVAVCRIFGGECLSSVLSGTAADVSERRTDAECEEGYVGKGRE